MNKARNAVFFTITTIGIVLMYILQGYMYGEDKNKFSNLVKTDYTSQKFSTVSKFVDLNEPVDAVYTWVNGSDIEFIKSLKTETKAVDPGGRRFTGTKYFFGKFQYKLGIVSFQFLKVLLRHESNAVFVEINRNVCSMDTKDFHRNKWSKAQLA